MKLKHKHGPSLFIMNRFVAWTPSMVESLTGPADFFLITELSHSLASLNCKSVVSAVVSMYKAFRNLTTQESAGYGLLCVFFAKGIDFMDNHMLDKRALNSSTSEQLAWNDRNKQTSTTRTY
ncbi:hypothetical protein V7S43_011173 [Phytophthora oleae]|uniref:Dynein heavy chain hydrolytic ATP-binding dynein motor region domain-containing protein n=1 Tax=Phytophthora oleae TaxID=2107226 RepID=A0ABD3FAF8_9STRA